MTDLGMREVFTRQQPLGPLASDGLHREHWVEFLRLYDEDNVLHRTARLQDPTLIVGRKGSGKTSLLMGSQQRRAIAVLGTGAIYSNFQAVVSTLERRGTTLYADGLAELWKLGFWHVVFLRLLKEHNGDEAPGHVQTLMGYVSEALAGNELKVRNARSTDMFGAFARMASALVASDTAFVSTADDLEIALRSGGIAFKEAKEAARILLESREQEVVIVIDNLEDLAVRIDDPGLQSCLRGLLHLIGTAEFGVDARSPFLIRKCFPSELIPRLHAISASPEKDFTRTIVIHWIAPEIVVMAARRWWLHLDLYGLRPDGVRWPDLAALSDPRIAKGFMRDLLPTTVTNGYGHTEGGLAYLLRHTQLLPRHLIGLINKTLERCPAERVGEHDLRAGIAEAEEILVQGILSSYRGSFDGPDAALARLRGRVPNVVRRAEFHSIYNKAGVKKTNGMQFAEFLGQLVAVGAIGSVTGETDRYYTANFHYTHEGRLEIPIDEDALLAFHPLFSRHLNCVNKRSGDRPAKAVYPYGSDPDVDDDYRSLLR